MDEKRFDELTTALSNANSRRGVLRGVAAGGLASALTAFGITREEADAKRRHRRRRRRKKIAIDISNNANGSSLGAVCDVTDDCLEGLACAGKKHKKTCQECTACGNSGKCCLVGVCGLAGLVQVCLL